MRPIDADVVIAEIEKRRRAAKTLTGVDMVMLINDTPTVGGWISVKDRLPDSNHVLARCEIRGLYKPKSYICVAFYAKKNSISVGNCFDDEISCEYDEETDEYYLREGWYEVIHNWDEYGSVVIGDFVTHWMPLPEPPKEVTGDADTH